MSDLLPVVSPPFRTIVRGKECNMSALFILLAAYGGWRAIRAGLDTLRCLPRSNEDMVFF